MGTSLMVNIPKGLQGALEGASSKFPLNNAIKLTRVIPSFKEAPNTSKCINYAKIIELMDGKYSKTLYDRHASALEKMARILSLGIPIADLDHILAIFKLLSARIADGGTLLLDSIPKIVSFFSAQLEIPTDFINGELLKNQISNIINELGKLTLFKHEEAIDAIADAIYYLSGGLAVSAPKVIQFNITAPIPPIQEEIDLKKYHKINLLATQINAVEESCIIEYITGAFKYAKSFAHQATILRALKRFSTFEITPSQFIEHGTVNLLHDILQNSSNDYVVFIAIEILWNLLTSPKKKEVAEILGSYECLSVLKILFEHFMINGSKDSDRHLRNELLVLLNEIAILHPDYISTFVDINLVDCISLFMVHIELRIHHPDVSHLIMSRDENDYEFKRLLIEITTSICRNEYALRIFLDSGLIQFLLIYLDIESGHPILEHWTPHQLRNLQFQCIGLLNSILPKIITELKNSNVFQILVKFLNHIKLQINTEEIKIFTKRETFGLIESTILLILHISELIPCNLKSLFGDLGLFKILMDIIGNPTYPVECWRVGLITCGSLCFGCKNNKVSFGATNWKSSVIPLMNFESPQEEEKEEILIGLMECLWGAVCGNLQNEEALFNASGVFSMLHLVEKESNRVQKHIFGCLLDLLENPKAIYHCYEWKSNNNSQIGMANLLIKLWNLEESKIGVKDGEDGRMLESLDPLFGENQKKRDFQIKSDTGRAIDEISENFRAKIYSLFSKLGFDRFQSSLDHSEKVKLVYISNYLDLKIGQVWEEIYTEFNYEEMRPITPDQELFDQSRSHVKTKVLSIQTKQAEFIKYQETVEKVGETLFLEEYKKDHPKACSGTLPNSRLMK